MENKFSVFQKGKGFKIGVYFTLIFFFFFIVIIVVNMIYYNGVSLEAVIGTIFFVFVDFLCLDIILYQVVINKKQIIIKRFFRKRVVIDFKEIKGDINTRVIRPRIGIKIVMVFIKTERKRIVIRYTNEELGYYLKKSGFQVK
jgi:hypothetical protein